jgi:LytS/YehU family sensor histidine kinase
MLYESGKEFITIEQEIQLMEDYIDLEKIRHRQAVDISFTKEIDNPAQRISPFLLLPFVENAFKHGVSESIIESSVTLAVKLSNGHLLFEIHNSKEEGTYGNSSDTAIGMKNSKRQLELIYPQHTLEVKDELKTFNVRLAINLSRDGKN